MCDNVDFDLITLLLMLLLIKSGSAQNECKELYVLWAYVPEGVLSHGKINTILKSSSEISVNFHVVGLGRFWLILEVNINSDSETLGFWIFVKTMRFEGRKMWKLMKHVSVKNSNQFLFLFYEENKILNNL